MTDRRVLIIRRWLVLVGVALLGLYDPVFWFGALAIIPCPECCGGTDCQHCSSTPSDTMQIDLVGMADNGLCTECQDLDGTYIATRTSDTPTLCRWFSVQSPSIACEVVNVNVILQSTAVSVRVVSENLGNQTVGNFSAAETAPYSCNFSARELPGTLSQYCSVASATATVTAL